MEREILFITSNAHKFSEAQSLLKKCNINIKRKNLNISEVRADTCEEVARQCALEAYRKLKRPLFVEDSGLFIDSLNGFPGVYSAWAMKRIGLGGILKLLEGKKRNAQYVCSICYADNAGLVCVNGKCKGKISKRQKGKGGFGHDPIFVPSGMKFTFAQNPKAKAELSHRVAALKALCARLAKR